MTGFIRATKNIETLQSDDIANAILYAIQAPNHVNANEILIRSIAQDNNPPYYDVEVSYVFIHNTVYSMNLIQVSNYDVISKSSRQCI